MYNDHRLTKCIWWWIVFFSQHHSNFCVCKPSTGLDIVAKEVQVEVLQTYKQFSSWVFYVVFLEKKEMSNDPLPKYSSCQGVGLKPVIVFWSCVVKIKNWAYVFCKHADYMRVCVCVCVLYGLQRPLWSFPACAELTLVGPELLSVTCQNTQQPHQQWTLARDGEREGGGRKWGIIEAVEE